MACVPALQPAAGGHALCRLHERRAQGPRSGLPCPRLTRPRRLYCGCLRYRGCLGSLLRHDPVLYWVLKVRLAALQPAAGPLTQQLDSMEAGIKAEPLMGCTGASPSACSASTSRPEDPVKVPACEIGFCVPSQSFCNHSCKGQGSYGAVCRPFSKAICSSRSWPRVQERPCLSHDY